MGLPTIGVIMSSLSSTENNEVGGVIGYCGAEIPDNDICSCWAAINCVMALYVSGVLFGGCGIGDG